MIFLMSLFKLVLILLFWRSNTAIPFQARVYRHRLCESWLNLGWYKAWLERLKMSRAIKRGIVILLRLPYGRRGKIKLMMMMPVRFCKI